MLVLLRVSLGWHFLYAGIEKLTSSGFTSAGFLSQAKGPLADKFHELVPDWEGHVRLDKAYYTSRMKSEAGDFERYYHFTAAQKTEAEAALRRRSEQVEQFLADKKADIETYFHDLDRLKEAKRASTKDVPFEQKRNWELQTKLRGQLAGWTAELGRFENDLLDDLRNLRTPDQVKMGTVPTSFSELMNQDNFITYSNLAIGACLIAGVFTRLAAFGGGLFLLSIVLAQPDWPGLFPSPPPSAGRTFIVGKEFIEMMAMFTLATTHVGRWAGLDFFIHHLIVRPLFGRKERV